MRTSVRPLICRTGVFRSAADFCVSFLFLSDRCSYTISLHLTLKVGERRLREVGERLRSSRPIKLSTWRWRVSRRVHGTLPTAAAANATPILRHYRPGGVMTKNKATESQRRWSRQQLATRRHGTSRGARKSGKKRRTRPTVPATYKILIQSWDLALSQQRRSRLARKRSLYYQRIPLERLQNIFHISWHIPSSFTWK